MGLIPGKLYDISARVMHKEYFYFIKKISQKFYGIHVITESSMVLIGNYGIARMRTDQTPLTEARAKMIIRGIWTGDTK